MPFRRYHLLLCTLCVTWSLFSLINVRTDGAEEGESGGGAAEKPLPASDEGRLAMSSFQKPAGWTVSLFAAEPEFANPVALYVDNQGRVFICESFRQGRGVTDNRNHDREWLLADLAAQSVEDRIAYHKRLLGDEIAEYTRHDDRIRMLQDTDGDGVADLQTVFAEGFNAIEDGTGAGVLVRGNQAYYACIPHLWSLKDEDGDGKAEYRQPLHSGYGVRVAFRGHDSHGLIIGPDGRIYFSIGDRGYKIETADGTLHDPESGAVFRCELDGSGLEVFATGLRNPQELAFDDYGYLFTGDNNSDSGDRARWVQVMQGGDTGWRMMYQYLPDRGPFNREKIWHPYSDETPAYIVPPIANIGDGPSGLACYPGTGLTGDFANCFFMVDFRGGASNSGVRLIRVKRKGAFWEVERSEQPLWNILATDIQFGPDGGLWVCDWVNGWVGEGKGRVYRFEDTAAQQQAIVREVKELLAAGFADLESKRLLDLLSHADRRIRNEAHWELAQRGDVAGLSSILAHSASTQFARMHAAWGLQYAGRTNSEVRDAAIAALRSSLADSSSDLRVVALGALADLRAEECAAEVLALISADEPQVQYAACLAAGQLQLSDSIDAVSKMLAENKDQDPGLRHAGIMALTGLPDSQLIADLAKHDSSSVRLAACVALRKRMASSVSAYLGDSDPRVVLEAARAIHDVPELHSQMAALAELDFSRVGTADPLVHRVLNANYRLGQPDGAKRLAEAAADSTLSLAMRTEALEMLGSWENPGPLDRVMNRYQEQTVREAGPAAEALQQNLAGILSGDSGATDQLVSATLRSLATLGLKGSAPQVAAIAKDDSRSDEARQAAIRSLTELLDADAAEALAELSADGAPVVRAAALSELAKLQPEAALPSLRQATKSGERAEYQAAWDTLAKIDLPEAREIIAQGVDAYVRGVLPPDAWLNVAEAANANGVDEVKSKIAAYLDGVTKDDVLAGYRDSLFGGDVGAGESLFFTKTELSCVRCHKVNGTGGEVGPDLSEIGQTKDNRYLLESIILPDAKIAEHYETVVLLTEDDEILTGVLRAETADRIELINAEAEIIKVDPEIVVARKKGKSAMPADLEKAISRRELRDLIAYLSSLKMAELKSHELPDE